MQELMKYAPDSLITIKEFKEHNRKTAIDALKNEEKIKRKMPTGRDGPKKKPKKKEDRIHEAKRMGALLRITVVDYLRGLFSV